MAFMGNKATPYIKDILPGKDDRTIEMVRKASFELFNTIAEIKRLSNTQLPVVKLQIEENNKNASKIIKFLNQFKLTFEQIAEIAKLAGAKVIQEKIEVLDDDVYMPFKKQITTLSPISEGGGKRNKRKTKRRQNKKRRTYKK